MLERDNGLSKLFVADFASPTNLVGQPAKGETTLAPENAADVAALTALLTPAVTTEVFTSADTPAFITSPPGGAPSPDKLEGLAIINSATVAITNDNDFGISNPADHTRIWILRLKAPLPN